ENANKVIADSFKAGNTALLAANEADRANKHDEAMKLYGDAIQQYDTGVAADPEHPGIASLLTNKSAALRSRAVDKYNGAIQSKKLKAQKDFAQMLFETAGDQAGYERAIAEYQKIIEKAPDDPDSLLRIGQAMFNIGALNNNDKAKYQEASNYLQRYVDKAPE